MAIYFLNVLSWKYKRYSIKVNTLPLLTVVVIVVLKIFLIYKIRKKKENYRINRLAKFVATLNFMVKHFSK